MAMFASQGSFCRTAGCIDARPAREIDEMHAIIACGAACPDLPHVTGHRHDHRFGVAAGHRHRPSAENPRNRQRPARFPARGLPGQTLSWLAPPKELSSNFPTDPGLPRITVAEFASIRAVSREIEQRPNSCESGYYLVEVLRFPSVYRYTLGIESTHPTTGTLRFMTNISTRRFFCRSASEVLGATGCCDPKPATPIRLGGNPNS